MPNTATRLRVNPPVLALQHCGVKLQTIATILGCNVDDLVESLAESEIEVLEAVLDIAAYYCWCAASDDPFDGFDEWLNEPHPGGKMLIGAPAKLFAEPPHLVTQVLRDAIEIKFRTKLGGGQVWPTRKR